MDRVTSDRLRPGQPSCHSATNTMYTFRIVAHATRKDILFVRGLFNKLPIDQPPMSIEGDLFGEQVSFRTKDIREIQAPKELMDYVVKFLQRSGRSQRLMVTNYKKAELLIYADLGFKKLPTQDLILLIHRDSDEVPRYLLM